MQPTPPRIDEPTVAPTPPTTSRGDVALAPGTRSQPTFYFVRKKSAFEKLKDKVQSLKTHLHDLWQGITTHEGGKQ